MWPGGREQRERRGMKLERQAGLRRPGAGSPTGRHG